MKPRLFSTVAVLFTLLAFPALALDLHEARRNGKVGEKPDGYVAAISAAPDINALVADVNAKRQQEYARIAKEKGQPVDVVGKLAAVEIIKGLEPGSPYQGADGSWKKR